MKHAYKSFTLYLDEIFRVQGKDTYFTYQNTGTSEALIQGSNDAIAWIDITLISAGASVIKTHSYSFLRMSGSTQVPEYANGWDMVVDVTVGVP
jgi:methionine synthase I (cobalamin-dependent)